MGIRRSTAVVLAALGTLTAGASTFAATAWAEPPLRVEAGAPQCVNKDALHLLPVPAGLKPVVDQGVGNSSTVMLTFHGASKDGRAVPYSVTVDGEQRASGSVGGGGKAINGVTLTNDKSSRVVVTSGPEVIFDRMITGHC